MSNKSRQLGTGLCRIGVDIGGTFTDVAAVDAAGRLHIGKRLTTHGAEHEGVIQAVLDTGVDANAAKTILAHGTTLVINALLERRGARVALVTTEHFADILDIGRGNRSEIFNMRFRREGPLVAREMRFEVAERSYGDGRVGRQPSDHELSALADAIRSSGAEAVAVAFLNSYIAPENERVVADYLRKALPGLTVTASSDISRQWREFERFTTASANAYVAPVADRYLKRIIGGLEERGFKGDFIVLDSSGGAMAVETARRFPIRAVESGPVGGVIAARRIAQSLSINNLVTFDMGGTTAKSALVEAGTYATKDLYWIGGEARGFPLQVSTVDIIEVGVGGGSIAWLNDTGGLQVGPRSAGSQPGPVCYGLGGTQVTLTDANLYCGRIDKDHFAGTFTLDLPAAKRAIEDLARRAGMGAERLALGIIRLANLGVAAAIRRQTLERGNDPKRYTLLASGGAGPLHACEVATEVGIDQVLIPRFPGHYSALGMLSANLRLDRREILQGPLANLDTQRLTSSIAGIAKELTQELAFGDRRDQADIRFSYSIAVRYRGQEHAIWIDGPPGSVEIPENAASYFRTQFEGEYARRYGHIDELSIAEVSELQVIGERILPPVDVDFTDRSDEQRASHTTLWGNEAAFKETPIIPRSTLRVGDTFTGPAIIHEVGATTAVPPSAAVRVLEGGLISITDLRLARG